MTKPSRTIATQVLRQRLRQLVTPPQQAATQVAKVMKKVVYLDQAKPENRLERLNRLTGLEFGNYPESLVQHCPQALQTEGETRKSTHLSAAKYGLSR